MRLTPEQKLWRAVLEQAYLDAELLAPDPDVSPKEYLRARSFLQAEDAEEALLLGIVCGFAEIPADRVIVWARRRYCAIVSVAPPPPAGNQSPSCDTEQEPPFTDHS